MLILPRPDEIFPDDLSLICLLTVFLFSTLSWLNKYVPINYGKQISSFFKFTINGRLSWFIFEIPNLLIAIYLMIEHRDNIVNYIMLLPFIIHYINRSIIYPMSLQENNKGMPLEIILFSLTFTSSNAYLQCKSILTQNLSEWDQLYKMHVLIGIAVFFIGMYINISSDKYLQSLKKNIVASSNKKNDGDSKANDKQYVIPRQGMFNYVTQANYFGEIVEWFGFAIMQVQSPMPWVFAFATLSILSSRAIESHKWYQMKFKEYPKNRKAILPFLI